LCIEKNYLTAIRDVSGDEASADDRQAEREPGGSVGHHHLKFAAKTSPRGRIPAT